MRSLIPRLYIERSDLTAPDPHRWYRQAMLGLTPAARRRRAAYDVILGRHFGYPRCCIAWFVWESWKKLRMPGCQQRIEGRASPKRYVECPRCAPARILHLG